VWRRSALTFCLKKQDGLPSTLTLVAGFHWGSSLLFATLSRQLSRSHCDSVRPLKIPRSAHGDTVGRYKLDDRAREPERWSCYGKLYATCDAELCYS
jgi:hypothetical protein